MEVLPCSGYFITCMGAHFPAVELDNIIWFSTLSSKSGFLWHSSKWAHKFSLFLQYASGIEVLACSLDSNLNYVTAMLQLHPSLIHYVFGCIPKDRYSVTPPALCPGLQAPCYIFRQNVYIFKIPS